MRYLLTPALLNKQETRGPRHSTSGVLSTRGVIVVSEGAVCIQRGIIPIELGQDRRLGYLRLVVWLELFFGVGIGNIDFLPLPLPPLPWGFLRRTAVQAPGQTLTESRRLSRGWH